MKKILLLVLSIFLITGCGNKENIEKEEQQNIINNSKVNKLDIIDFITTYEEGISSIYYTVENNTEESINYNYVICNMYDENNNLIYTVKSDLGNLNPTESKDINENITMDLSQVTSVKYNVE